jgi:hypothetical protein
VLAEGRQQAFLGVSHGALVMRQLYARVHRKFHS